MDGKMSSKEVDEVASEEEKKLTYTFQTKEKGNVTISKLRRKIWQVFPSVCGCMMCLPFGLMLGWPSSIYPHLIDNKNLEKLPLSITIDQSAMVAGFLMIGNSVSTPFSQFRRFGAKYGILGGVSLMLLGWLLMWQARDIYWLLGSRLLIGIGNGYSLGQLKLYISEICQQSLSISLIKSINLYVFFGMIMSFAIAPFVRFEQFSIISIIITVLVLFLTIFLPSTPRELIQSGKVTDAKKLIAFLSPHLNVEQEMTKIKSSIHLGDTSLNFFEILKKPQLRRNFIIFSFLVFFQQFSGLPSTLVYTQIIFSHETINIPRPDLCALLYIVVFFIANAYAIFCMSNFNTKYVLICSSVGVSLLLSLQIVVILKSINVNFWNFSFLIVLLLYNIIHTIGLGNIPVQMAKDLFPPEAIKIIIHFFIVFHSLLALLITKIFQVLMHRAGLFAPFCLFLVVSVCSVIFVITVVPNRKEKIENV